MQRYDKAGTFFIDDAIWFLWDITRQRPARLFDNPFLGVLKTAHDRYGVKTQLNLFYKTSYFYGMDDFSLADVTDAYKAEWEASSDWLKLAFHAKEEFPDYPHLNADYDDVKTLFENITREIIRFAGVKSVAQGICPHWLPVSKDGVRALYDCGVRLVASTAGETAEYNGDPESLPYGHAMRLLQNRKPETKTFHRVGEGEAIERSACGYNHIPADVAETLFTASDSLLDAETGMRFKVIDNLILNLTDLDQIETAFEPFLNAEYFGIGDHEQYFYEDYFAYQPDYAERIYKMGEILQKNGFEFIFFGDLLK